MRKFVTVVATAGLAFGLAGCGGGDNGPEKAVKTFADAVTSQDYETVCNTLDPEMVETLEQVSQDKDCAEMFKENEDAFQSEIPDNATVDIQGSEISDDGDTATVTVKNQDGDEEDVKLVKVEDEWKVTFD